MHIIETIPNYDGSFSFPPASLPVGNFNFAPPAGDMVLGGTISGTFGNTDVPGFTDNSAPADLFVDNGMIQVAACDDSLPYSLTCDSGSSPTPFSYTLSASDLSTLAGEIAAGSIDFSAMQNGIGAVNLGSLTLDLSLVPEPASIALLGGAIAGLALLRRLRLQ